jgi:hypothetical protein
MVGTRNSQKAEFEDEKAPRLRNQEHEASDSDSDDAPEEVGFVASKKVRLMGPNLLEFKPEFAKVEQHA